MPYASVLALAVGLHPLGTALAASAICVLLVAVALTLPGRAPAGFALGLGTTLASMAEVAHPAASGYAFAGYGLTALACGALAIPARHRATRVRGWGSMIRTGGFWLAIPTAALGVVAAAGSPSRHLTVLASAALVVTAGVFAVVASAARSRGRDLSIGYVAGTLVALAALIGAVYAHAAGARLLFAYPADLTGLIAVGAAARIGLDPVFATWQRVATLATGATTLVVVRSPTAFIAAAVAALAYLVLRLRGGRLPPQLRERPLVAAARGALPVLAVAGLWLICGYALPSGPAPAGVTGLVALGDADTDAVGRLVADPVRAPSLFSAIGIAGAVTLLVGGVLVMWRVTGPGLPMWIPVVGVSALVGVLASGPVGLAGPSPAWVLAIGAELWVFGHGLRADRDVTPAPPIRDST